MIGRDLAAWCENDRPQTICLPSGPNVKVSIRCADSDAGLLFTAALVKYALAEWSE